MPAAIVVPSNVEGGKLPGASVDNAQADTPDANASTPPKVRCALYSVQVQSIPLRFAS